MIAGPAQPIVITGATGLIGGATAVAVAQNPDARIIAPCRSHHEPQTIKEHWLAAQADMLDLPWTAAQQARVDIRPAANDDLLSTLPDRAAGVIHAAACLDYVDPDQAQIINVELTRSLVDWAETRGCRRFIHLSTAFAAGLTDMVIPEGPLEEPSDDPNCYTRTKRAAEAIVAAADLNICIIRPAVVIGHAINGRYHGRPYGLYQLLDAISRIPPDIIHDTWHLALPTTPLPVIPIDRVTDVIVAATQAIDPEPYINVVPDDQQSIGARDLFECALDQLHQPPTIRWYHPGERLDRTAPMPFKVLARLLKGNLALIGRPWRWQTGAAHRLTGTHTSLNSDMILRCAEWYLSRAQTPGLVWRSS